MKDLNATITEALNYKSSSTDITVVATEVAELPTKQLVYFLTMLSAAFEDKFDDDSERTDARDFAKELLKLVPKAKRVDQ